MRSTIAVGAERSLTFARLTVFATVVFFVLFWSAVTVFGQVGHAAAQGGGEGDPGTVDAEFEWEMEEDDDAVTVTFDLEEGGRIDLGMPGDIVIDTWKGDDVLLVVERAKSRSKNGAARARPLRLHVSRLGNNVKITALHEREGKGTEGDVSFRIVVPTERDNAKVRDVYDLSRVTSVVLSALHREAIRWILH
jgi:hypothetical protein